MIDQVGYWALVAVGFGFLIFIHELGHFVAARLVGIRIVRFAIGFGPRLFGTNRSVDHKDHDKRVPGTDYCLCLIPCGGYVKMAGGEGEGDADVTGAPDEFPSKTPGQRALVVASGPFMSIVIALPLFFAAFMMGLERPSSRVNHIVPEMPAWHTGMKRGDLITGLKIEGETEWQSIRLWRDVKLNQILQEKVGKIVVRVERDGIEKQFSMTTKNGNGHLIGIEPAIAGKGMGKQMGYISTLMGHVPGDSGFAKAGITPGSRIREVNGRKVATWGDINAEFLTKPSQQVSIKFDDKNGASRAANVMVKSETYWWLGIQTEVPSAAGLIRPNFPAARAGIKPGDRITAVGGQPVANWLELKDRVMAAAPGAVKLTVATGSESRDVEVILENGDEMADVAGMARPLPVVTGFAKGSDAEKAGVKVGDTLLTFFCRNPQGADAKTETDVAEAPTEKKEPYGGTRFDRVPPVRELIFAPGTNRSGKPTPLNVLVERGGEKHVAKVTPVLGEWGVPDASARIERCRVVPAGNIGAALTQSVKETGDWIGLAGKTLLMLVQGQFSFGMVSGPLGIFAVSRSQAEVGILTFLEFMVIITVHLGVLNLVPFPILDGGHLAFLAVEKVRGKPCPERLMAGLMYGGMVALLALMLFVTWNDISRIWG